MYRLINYKITSILIIVLCLFSIPVEADFLDDVKSKFEDIKQVLNDALRTSDSAGDPKNVTEEKNEPAPVTTAIEKKNNSPQFDVSWILEIQRLLTAQGLDPGGADGFFNGKTQAAIKKFEKSKQMKVAGLPTPVVMDALRKQPKKEVTSSISNKKKSVKEEPKNSKRISNIASTSSVLPPKLKNNQSSEKEHSKSFFANLFDDISAVSLKNDSSEISSSTIDMSELANRFGLHTRLGRPVIVGQNAYFANKKLLTEKENTSLINFFERIRLVTNPELVGYASSRSIGEKSEEQAKQSSQSYSGRALCIAQLFLSEEQKSQVLESNIYSTNWKGTAHNELEVERSIKLFTTEFLPQVLSNVPTFPLEFVYISPVYLENYNLQKEGFPITGGVPLSLPSTNCIKHRNLASDLPFVTELPSFWALDSETAEKQIINRILVEPNGGAREHRRKVFAATIFSLSPAPSAKTKTPYQNRSSLTPLKLAVKSFALYEDPTLKQLLHQFKLVQPAVQPVLLTGVPKIITVPKQQRLDQETVTLLLLKKRGDILDGKAWQTLAKQHLKNDEAYYMREKKWWVGLSYKTSKMKSFDPEYMPFFPYGFNLDYQTGLNAEQLEIFKQWSLKRAVMLPDKFVWQTSLKRDQNNNVTMDIDSYRVNDSSALLAQLVARGFVPGQVISSGFERKAMGGHSKFKITLNTGKDKSIEPVIVVSNMLKSYAPDISEAEGQKLFGDNYNSYQWISEVELDIIMLKTQQIEINQNSDALVIHARPKAVRILNNDSTAVVYQQAYQNKTLNPNSSIASLTISTPEQLILPFSAEVADLLMVKFLPETLNDDAAERMILARWHYENSFNNSEEEPQWGRFFVEGKPRPDAQQRTELMSQFKKWTVKRAKAIQTKVSVVFHDVKANNPGPLQLGTGLFDYRFKQTPMGWEVQNCLSEAKRMRDSYSVLSKTYDRACEFLKSASMILSQEIYIGNISGGNANYLFLEKRAKLLKSSGSLHGQGVGSRINCGKTIYGEDKYCRAMLDELGDELFGKPFEIDDVLVFDKELVVPDNPAINAPKNSDSVVEIDLDVTGIKRQSKLPLHPFVKSFKQFEGFSLKTGLNFKGGEWRSMFEKKTVPLFLFNVRIIEARIVKKSRDSGRLIAKFLLKEPTIADSSVLKIVEPERLAISSKPYGHDVMGVRLGMSFDEADSILRKKIEVGRVLKADRAWQTKAVIGDISPYTSGWMYESKDGNELIILYDEPPAAQGIVMGMGRRISYSRGKRSPASIFDELNNKYGDKRSINPSGGNGQVWYEGQTKGEIIDYSCLPSFNPGENLSIWRNIDNSTVNWAQTTLKKHSTYSPALTCGNCYDNLPYLSKCKAGLMATLDTSTNQKSDDLLVLLFNQKIYSEMFMESKRLINKGEGSISTLDLAPSVIWPFKPKESLETGEEESNKKSYFANGFLLLLRLSLGIGLILLGLLITKTIIVKKIPQFKTVINILEPIKVPLLFVVVLIASLSLLIDLMFLEPLVANGLPQVLAVVAGIILFRTELNENPIQFGEKQKIQKIKSILDEKAVYIQQIESNAMPLGFSSILFGCVHLIFGGVIIF